MEPHQHFLLTALLMTLIVIVLGLDLWVAVEWVFIASAVGVLYDIDHILYGLMKGKLEIKDILNGPMLVHKITKAGLLPKNVDIHNVFIALLLTLLAGIATPYWAVPIGIGLTFHILCDEIDNLRGR